MPMAENFSIWLTSEMDARGWNNSVLARTPTVLVTAADWSTPRGVFASGEGSTPPLVQDPKTNRAAYVRFCKQAVRLQGALNLLHRCSVRLWKGPCARAPS